MVRAAVPEGYRIVMAHQCGYAGRKFVHLTLENNGSLLSLVMRTGRMENRWTACVRRPIVSESRFTNRLPGITRLPGFEAGDFLAYIVSDLKAQGESPDRREPRSWVHEFLMKTRA